MELKKVYLHKLVGQKTDPASPIDKIDVYETKTAEARVNTMGWEKQSLIFGKVYKEALIIRVIGTFDAETISFTKDGTKYQVSAKKYHDNNSIFYVATNKGVINLG